MSSRRPQSPGRPIDLPRFLLFPPLLVTAIKRLPGRHERRPNPSSLLIGGAPDLAHVPFSNGVLQVHAESARWPLGYESYHPAARGPGPTSDREWTLPLGPPMTDQTPTLRKSVSRSAAGPRAAGPTAHAGRCV